MTQIQGTKGYESGVERFATATESISFEVLHQEFLAFLPEQKSMILDIGAGIGRDAYVLAEKGHEVIAAEPLAAFREKGKDLYPSENLTWLDTSLPELEKLENYKGKFAFILCSAVWHHIREEDQKVAMGKIAQLLKTEGIFALSLRNGPAGMGKNVFPTDCQEMINCAEAHGLIALQRVENQASLLPGKESVKWARLVLQKK